MRSSSQDEVAGEDGSKNQFAIWSEEELQAVTQLNLTSYYQELIQTIILMMDTWIHHHHTGWYKTQINQLRLKKQELNEKKEDTQHLDAIQSSLLRYLKVAFKLRQPLKNQKEFWDQCIYQLFENYLSLKKNVDTLDHQKAKIIIYALSILKEEELPCVQLPLSSLEKLCIAIDGTINHVRSKLEHDFPLFVTEEEAIAARDVLHEIMPKYHLLMDLKLNFNLTPMVARYVHIPPALLVQFAEMIDYVHGVISDAAANKKSFLMRKYPQIAQDKASKLLDMLNAKRNDIAAVMTFQVRLYLSFGDEEFIKVLHTLVGNKSDSVLPSAKFFEYQEKIKFYVGNLFSHSVVVSDSSSHRDWRWAYISRGNSSKEIGVLIQDDVNGWLNAQAVKKKNAVEDNLPRCLKTQSLYVVNKIAQDAMVTFSSKKIPAVPEVVMPLFISKYSVSLLASYASQVGGNGFFAVEIVDDKELYDFFIERSAEREMFFGIHRRVDYRVLNILENQVDHKIKLMEIFLRRPYSVGELIQPQASYLYLSDEARENFKSMLDSMRGFFECCDAELQRVASMKKLSNSPKFKSYVQSVELIRLVFCDKIKRILKHWIAEVKPVDPYPFRGITELNRLLRDALIIFNDKQMLADFDGNVSGAYIITNKM